MHTVVYGAWEAVYISESVGRICFLHCLLTVPTRVTSSSVAYGVLSFCVFAL